MKFAITGGSGFIGSHLAKRLVNENHHVTILNYKKLNSKNRLESILDKIDIIGLDFDNLEEVKKELKGFDVIAHFAANASTQSGLQNTDVDLKRGIISTYNILEAMRINNIKKIIFPSAPAIYGMPAKIPTPEDAGMLLPLSLYGAAKLASEGMISAFCHLFSIKSWIFRLGNVVGPDMNRGVIIDFIQKLNEDPHNLEILGDGQQKKDIIYVDDCIDGILFLFKNSNDVVNVFNLSSGTTITVKKIAEIIQKEMNLENVKVNFTGSEVGWLGDVPLINYDVSKAKKNGWESKYDSEEAIKLAVKFLLNKN